MLVARAAAFALPEVIIALFDGENTFRPLRRFTNTLVLASTVFIVIFIATPLLGFYLFVVQDLTPPVASMARMGLILFIPLPALATLISWIRGLMINQKSTAAVNIGMLLNLFATAAILFTGITENWSGINTAAIALCIAAGVEFLFLWWKIGGVLPFHFSLFELRKSPVTN